VLVFAINQPSVRVSKKICFRERGNNVVFGLKGIIYTGNFHYTARVCTHGVVWVHDVMVIGRN
jgi:hypothetical protein